VRTASSNRAFGCARICFNSPQCTPTEPQLDTNLTLRASCCEISCMFCLIEKPSHGPSGGVADTLDEAKAAFRREWDALAAKTQIFVRWKQDSRVRGIPSALCDLQRKGTVINEHEVCARDRRRRVGLSASDQRGGTASALSVRWRRNAARSSRCREQMIRARMRAKMAVMTDSLGGGRPEPARLSIGRRSGARALLPEAKTCPTTANRAGNRGTR
jgi:hypothetical protein